MLEAASDIDRKYFLAFLKGLCQIKYKDLYTKLRIAEGEAIEENMTLEFLYSNLFDPASVSADTFNQLVESGMQLIGELLEKNPSKDGLDTYLQRKVQAREETKKTIILFWKQESP